MRKTIFSKQGKLISARVRELRVEAGLTSRDLSALLGKGHSFISNCEVGQRRVDIAEFFWICKKCGADPRKHMDELIEEFEAI